MQRSAPREQDNCGHNYGDQQMDMMEKMHGKGQKKQ
jgi:hypothetical protein